MMVEVRSPFNFVPLNKSVFYPDWAQLINQDIPFENGLSGSVEVTIKAETPIFVRNGHTDEDQKANNDVYKSFSKFPDGRFFIPGASVKGAVRSVLEILSMGKMHVDKNAMFAWPRLDPGAKMDMTKIKCGWLFRRQNDSYYISVCKGNPRRIALWEIDRLFETHILEEHFSGEGHFNLNTEKNLNGQNYDPKTAAFKYALLRSLGKEIRLDNRYFSYGEKDTMVPDEDGDFKGTIVLTGQPDKKRNWGKPNRRMGEGKWKEFIFPSEIDHELELDEDLFDRYKSLYQDSPDWSLKIKDIDTVGMPIFLREDKNGLVDFGLTFMYKVPYKHVPQDLIPGKDSQNEDDEYFPDLAECMFGYTSKKESLRGRVQFSNFVSDDAKEDLECCLVLNGPKASYYPFYIRQDNGKNGFTNRYQNYNDGAIAGRKRYILRDSIWQKKAETETVNSDLHPLKAGSSFKGIVHFHNLLPEELGALLSALTFHGHDKCYHQIGQAKPYGFGKVSLKLDTLKVPSYMGLTLRENDFYMACFEKMMQAYEPSWRYENSLKELFTLSSVVVKGNDTKYQYMEMSMERNANEFNNVKKEKLYLEDYTQRVGKTLFPESRLDKYQEEFDEIQKQLEKKKAEAERLEQERKEEEARKAQKAKEKQAAEELAARQAERSEAGLSVLDELRADQKGYKVTSFKQAKPKIQRWMKEVDVSTLPQKQTEQLWATLQRLFAEPDKKEKKEWVNMDSKLWKDITTFTSEAIAAFWFNELNK